METNEHAVLQRVQSSCASCCRKKSHRSRKLGAAMVEYVFLVMFIVLVALLGIKTFGGTVTNQFSNNNNTVVNAIQ